MNKSVWVVILASAIVVGGQGGGGFEVRHRFRTGRAGHRSGAAALRPPTPGTAQLRQADVLTHGRSDRIPPKAIVEPKELEVAKRNGDATMVWELTNADYEFRNDSITFTLEACEDEFKDIRPLRTEAIPRHQGNVTEHVRLYGAVYKRSDGTAVALDPAISRRQLMGRARIARWPKDPTGQGVTIWRLESLRRASPAPRPR